MSWNASKEQQLLKLEKELQALQGERAAAVRRVETCARALMASGPWDAGNAVKLTGLMIKHADELRDALAPFDSGVRGTQVPPAPWQIPAGGGLPHVSV